MYLILGHLRDLVNTAASWSLELTKLVVMHPDAIFSLIDNPLLYAWSSHERLGWMRCEEQLDYHILASFVHHFQILAHGEDVLAI